MSRLFCFVAAAGMALAATACQKTGVSPAPGLVGEWSWVISRGGFTGNQTYTPASTGTVRQWVFRADSTFQQRETRQGAAQPAQVGTYSLGAVSSIYTGQPARSLTLRLGQQAEVYVLSELGSRLVVADNQYDGFTDTYERR